MIKKLVEMWKCSYDETDKRVSYQELEKTNIGQLSVKVANSIERTVMIDFKVCCLYVVLDLPGSVETQLGWSGKFHQLLWRVFIPVSTGTNSIKIDQEKPEL